MGAELQRNLDNGGGNQLTRVLSKQISDITAQSKRAERMCKLIEMYQCWLKGESKTKSGEDVYQLDDDEITELENYEAHLISGTLTMMKIHEIERYMTFLPDDEKKVIIDMFLKTMNDPYADVEAKLWLSLRLNGDGTLKSMTSMLSSLTSQ